jgi:magnesium transporter
VQPPDTVDLEDLSARRARHEPVWLDLLDPDDEDLTAVAEVLGLHPLALEDSREFGQRPKLDRYEDGWLLVVFGLAMEPGGTPRLVEVHVHVVGSCVLTVSRRPLARLERLRRRLDGDRGRGELVYRIVDAVVDSLTEGLETVAEEVDAFEETIFDHPRARDRDRMAVLRRALNGLRRTLVVQRQVFPRVVDQVALAADDAEVSRTYLADVGDHLSQALDEIEADRESLQGMLDTYSNEVQERLTIVATVFLPLTVLTGFFGTNFQWLLDHIGSAWAFFGFGVGGTLLSCLAIVLWLRRTGLLERPRAEVEEP